MSGNGRLPLPRTGPRLGRWWRPAITLTAALALLAPAAATTAAPAVRRPHSAAVATWSPGATRHHGLDAAALQAALDALTAGYGVGAVAQVVGPDGRWSGASGVRRLDRGTPPARPGDRVRIASVTKPMVATLALQLVAGGRWSLETRVDDVLPGLLPGHGEVTLRQLLSHRSGLPDFVGPLLADVTTPQEAIAVISRHYTDAELVRAALTLPWTFQPGSDFAYSNTNYVVVGMMLAHATGEPVARLLRERVFRPARMWHSRLGTSPRIAGVHLTEYAIFDRPYSLASFDPTFLSSAGAVVSTAADVNRFFGALSSGRLLPQRLVEAMRTPLTPPPDAYGLGTSLFADVCPGPGGEPQLLYGHVGGSFGTLTLALSSFDGSRRFAVSVTGRHVDPAVALPPIEEFAVAALTATCPAQSVTAQRREQLRIPWLDRGLETW